MVQLLLSLILIVLSDIRDNTRPAARTPPAPMTIPPPDLAGIDRLDKTVEEAVWRRRSMYGPRIRRLRGARDDFSDR